MKSNPDCAIAITVILFCTAWNASQAGEPQEQPEHSIVLSADAGPVTFGSDTTVRVTYRNSGRLPWSVVEPNESMAVVLYYRLAGTERRPQGYSLGRITSKTITLPDGRPVEAWLAPKPNRISIAAGKAHEFEVKFERGWTGDVVPGRWTVWIEDKDAELKSNSIEIPIQFTTKSLDICLDVAMDKKQSMFKRKWHSRWLARIDPSLKLEWPGDDAAEDVKARHERDIQMKLGATKRFIQNKNNAELIQDAITRINREGGLVPEKPKGDTVR